MFESLFGKSKSKAELEQDITRTQDKLEDLSQKTAPHAMHEEASWEERVLKHKLARAISDKENLEASNEKSD